MWPSSKQVDTSCLRPSPETEAEFSLYISYSRANEFSLTFVLKIKPSVMDKPLRRKTQQTRLFFGCLLESLCVRGQCS